MFFEKYKRYHVIMKQVSILVFTAEMAKLGLTDRQLIQSFSHLSVVFRWHVGFWAECCIAFITSTDCTYHTIHCLTRHFSF